MAVNNIEHLPNQIQEPYAIVLKLEEHFPY